MIPEENLAAVEKLLYSFYGRHLTHIQSIVLRGSSANQTYETIAMENDYSVQHIRHEGWKLWQLLSQSLGERVSKSNFQAALGRWLINNYQNNNEEPYDQEQEDNSQNVIRSIEFPPDYWEAGTSILTYFSHILKVKYPDTKIKVRIEQEDLTLRLVIDTSTGQREQIEKTLGEYGMVIAGRLPAEIFLEDPLEVMALKNKLEIANLELRQARMLLSYTQNNSQSRIESLETQVYRLHQIIEGGLQNGDTVLGVIRGMTEQKGNSYDFSNAKFGGGFASEGGFQVGGTLLDVSSTNLSEAAKQIQELLLQLQTEGMSLEEAQQQAAKDLVKQAENNPTVMGKLVQWGKSLADTASKTTVSEAAKGVVKLALQMAGIPLP